MTSQVWLCIIGSALVTCGCYEGLLLCCIPEFCKQKMVVLETTKTLLTTPWFVQHGGEKYTFRWGVHVTLFVCLRPRDRSSGETEFSRFT